MPATFIAGGPLIDDDPIPPSQPASKQELDDILQEALELRQTPSGRMHIGPHGAEPGKQTAEPSRLGPPGRNPPSPRPPEYDRPPETVRYISSNQITEPGEVRYRTFYLSRQMIAALALGAIAIALWGTSPEGLSGLRLRPLPATYTDASSRWALVLMSERVDRFQADHSRLPLTLGEIGPDSSGVVSYQRLTDHDYRLEAPGETSVLVLDPSTPRRPFLRSSIELLRAGPNDAR